jgi:hypothetical protein
MADDLSERRKVAYEWAKHAFGVDPPKPIQNDEIPAHYVKPKETDYAQLLKETLLEIEYWQALSQSPDQTDVIRRRAAEAIVSLVDERNRLQDRLGLPKGWTEASPLTGDITFYESDSAEAHMTEDGKVVFTPKETEESGTRIADGDFIPLTFQPDGTARVAGWNDQTNQSQSKKQESTSTPLEDPSILKRRNRRISRRQKPKESD